jgi:hypothetical protein
MGDVVDKFVRFFVQIYKFLLKCKVFVHNKLSSVVLCRSGITHTIVYIRAFECVMYYAYDNKLQNLIPT